MAFSSISKTHAHRKTNKQIATHVSHSRTTENLVFGEITESIKHLNTGNGNHRAVNGYAILGTEKICYIG